ncbi:MAG: transcription-repair coupling factor [Paludibacteraceae bacterium]|nr:transcription-repair coupling factor [Paludibacteraceae bacterium]
MNYNNIIQILAGHPLVKDATKWIKSKSQNLQINGLQASGKGMMLGAIQQKSKAKMLVVMEDAETAAYLYNDINRAIPTGQCGLLPSSYKKSPKHGGLDLASEIMRTDALNIIHNPHDNGWLIITSPEGLIERVATKQTFEKKRLTIRKGEEIDTEAIIRSLTEWGFELVEFVYEPGQYAQRGSIIDIFSFSNERPYRIDLWGDEVESIRIFDIEKQLSINEIDKINILPNVTAKSNKETVSIFNFLPQDTIICWANMTFAIERINDIYDDTLIKQHSEKNVADVLNLLINGNIAKEQIVDFRHITLKNTNLLNSAQPSTLNFNQSAQPPYHKNFDIVADSLRSFINEGYAIHICSDSKKQTDRIAAIFDERGDNIHFSAIEGTIHEGFIDHDLSVCFFTDHQIFDRYHKFSLKSDIAKAGKVSMTLKEINQLQIGDYVVHIDHGIGKFAGLMVAENNGKRQEVIKLLYQNDDAIFVSIHGLHRISKYKGKDGEPPRMNKLGSGAWERLKERTKAKVKDIARDLILLYAARKAEKGFQFTPDSYLQHELEASFIYEDTPDQAKSTADIKQDMESSLPMDRLVCGDVGFGKTELAIRAAFKAATDGKQVAVLVPTTVLALQHYKTFSERLKDFPCKVEYLSRAKKPSEVKLIKQQLAEGKIDILIGTHKIVGKDILFKDLGLLIIDEEQKFGVSVKEKLKAMKVNVDTLTLTATPIPRTLQFSLMGARDLSILTTPPSNRYPVTTEVCTYDDEIIRDAIVTEMNRNGQVFLINNRVQNIYLIEQKVRALVPDARVAVAHGQMPTEQLEQTIIDFIDYEYDVLIATSVIESGVDIPNVNTIIVHNAHMFGLSDLHQLRGRVGRSNRKAYCYLMAPPLNALTSDARRRLQAIETFAELGSGFNIAMQDLDIRGAGNILGAEQSGFITDLGYETYQKILNEALSELRDQEFSQLFADRKDANNNYVHDCFIESDMELMLPNWYVESQTERMALYRELDNIQDERALEEYRKRLTDRFGRIPDEAGDLMTMVRLRWLAQRYGVERLILKRGKMHAYLVSNTKSAFYESKEFETLIQFCMTNYKRCALSEKDNKRIVQVSNINSVDDAYSIFNELSIKK